jgi:hypothetical protein
MTVFGDVAPCSLVEVYRRFRGDAASIIIIALIMEAASTSEMLVNFYQTTRLNIRKIFIFILAAVGT